VTMNDHGPQKQPSSAAKINAETRQVRRVILDDYQATSRKTCDGCQHYRFGAMSCFGPDVYLCELHSRQTTAKDTCDQWAAKPEIVRTDR